MDNQEIKQVVLYKTYFYFPFKIEHGVNIDDKIRIDNTSDLRWETTGFDLCAEGGSANIPNTLPNNQEFVYFHKYLRRILFSRKEVYGADEKLLLAYYRVRKNGKELNYGKSKRILINCQDKGFYIIDLGLYIFKDSNIGILSVCVENEGCTLKDAMEFNQLFRIIYISDTRQLSDLKENRGTRIYRLITIEDVMDNFTNEFTNEKHLYIDKNEPLPDSITSILERLIPFKYKKAYSPILDDRMTLHTLFCLDNSLKESYINDTNGKSEAYRQLFSRILFVDSYGEGYAYNDNFMRELLKKHIYDRWTHYGTLHGFCRYADAAVMFSRFELLENNFATVYCMMSILALFYRCALIDFAEQSSRATRLFVKEGKLNSEDKKHIRDLRKRFIEFSNVWYFKEVTNQDQGIEMFEMQRKSYELDVLFNRVKEDIDSIDEFIRIEQGEQFNKKIGYLNWMIVFLTIITMLTGFIQIWNKMPPSIKSWFE
jgi:hypothetical protein